MAKLLDRCLEDPVKFCAVIRKLPPNKTSATHKNHTPRWLKALPEVTKAYNHAIHRSIKMTPTEARTADRVDLWNNQYQAKNPRKRKHSPKVKPVFKFKVNDRVRLSGFRSLFERAYTEKWTHEIYTITERENNQGYALYSIKSWNNEPIEGKFYDKEMQKVSDADDIEYIIDKVIRKQKNRIKKMSIL